VGLGRYRYIDRDQYVVDLLWRFGYLVTDYPQTKCGCGFASAAFFVTLKQYN